MSDKKYSVFISSTFDDLKDERMAVLRAILQHGHFPLGMELWGAADELQWQIIQRQIDVADYYVVIVAHRYGSLSDTGVSWTEREYDYAIEKGVPVLGFVQKSGSWPPEFVDKGENAERLERFRAKVQSKPVSFWSSADNLTKEVVLALSRQMQSKPRVGWVRATEAITSATADELARLSNENDQLRKTISKLTAKSLPPVSFEVESASVNSVTPNRYGLGLAVDVEFSAALHQGQSIGIREGKGVSLEIKIGDQPPINLEARLGGYDPSGKRHLEIAGPVDFWVEARQDIQYPNGDWERSKALLFVTLTPIGHSDSFRITVPLKPAKWEEGSNKIWELDHDVLIKQESFSAGSEKAF